MPAKFFGQFLLEKSLIDKEELLKALEIQRISNPKLGEIAVSLNMLNEEQANKVNQKQLSEDKRFGDIAIEMGLLIDEQINQILEKQKSQRKFFGEILVEEKMISQDDLDIQLKFHQEEREDAVKSFESGITQHPLGSFMSSAINTSCKLFMRILKTQCQFSSLINNENLASATSNTCHVTITGNKPFILSLSCDDVTLMNIATTFINIEPSACDELLAKDALGEFLNVIMGYVIKESLTQEDNYKSSPPNFSKTIATLNSDSQQMLAVNMTSQLGSFSLLLYN